MKVQLNHSLKNIHKDKHKVTAQQKIIHLEITYHFEAFFSFFNKMIQEAAIKIDQAHVTFEIGQVLKISLQKKQLLKYP